jgi:hypothetical protein
MRHDLETRREVLDLVESGVPLLRISKMTGICRATIRRWRDDPRPLQALAGDPDPAWRPPDGPVYCYLLGLYLGDGCISASGTSLRITLDAQYGELVGRARGAMLTTFPGRHVGMYRHAVHRKVDLQVNHRSLPYAFPQHGPGRKHERQIELVPWQVELTRAYPERLVLGLIHSDGSRCVNRFATRLPSGRLAHYEYPRYFFTNYSADIRRIFTDHCELLGIRWTQSNWRNVSVSHRRSTALLDSFVGPKR